MSSNNLVIGDIISSAWEGIKKNLWIFVGVTFAFYLVILSIFSFAGGMSAITALTANNIGSNPGAIFGLMFGGSMLLTMLLILIVSYIFYIGYYSMALIVADGGKPTLSVFTFSGSKIVNMIVAGLIVGIVVYIGTLLCIIPGLYLAARLFLFGFFIIDEDCNFIDAMKKSWEATKGEVLNIVLIILVLYLINILGAICCGVGMFVTTPMTVIALAILYRKLTNNYASVV
jgi:Predicted integral membrane protein